MKRASGAWADLESRVEKIMPVLPLIDLLIWLGWTSLFGAFALKAIAITTSYQPQLFGLGPMDLTILAAVFLLFSLALAARSWVKTLETPASSVARDRAAATLDAYSAVQAEARRAEDHKNGGPSQPSNSAPASTKAQRA